METRASYLLVGTFSLLVMAIFAAAVIWMAGVNLQEEFTYYDIHFDGSVTGLKPGNAVRYRGVPVGVVSDIIISPSNVEQVRATIEVPASTPIKTDTVASLEYQGITGVAYVQLSGGTHDAPLLKKQPDEDRPRIPAKSSQLQELFESAPELISSISALVGRANQLLNPGNRENISKIIENTQVFSKVLAERSQDIGETMKSLRTASDEAAGTMRTINKSAGTLTGDAAVTLRNLRDLAADMQKLSKVLNTEVGGVGAEAKQALSEVRKTAVEFRRAAFVLSDLIESNRDPVDTFASSGLYELTQLLSETRVLVGALSRISAQIERDPARFLFGRTQPGVKVK